MRAILISDHARWCVLMMNGKKKIEVRKGTALYKAIQKLIDQYGYADIYVYCTKLHYFGHISNRYIGKVLFKFRCYKVEEIKFINPNRTCGFSCEISDDDCYYNINEKECCLSQDDLYDYLQGKVGTAIHISDLEIFDRPKELCEFKPFNKRGVPQYEVANGKFEHLKLHKPPQSWCYVEELL